MKDLTIIHSFVDRSSIVLVRIPLKTARLSSLFSALLPIWVYLSCSSEPLPLIYVQPPVNDHRLGLGRHLNCNIGLQLRFSLSVISYVSS